MNTTVTSEASPVVSVIVPVYNVRPYLRQCLDSLVGQTMYDIEIICVDDGSTDGCAEILAEYAAKDVRVRVITRENGGLSAARNTGLDAAQAPFIMFCDSDDWYTPTMCEKMYKAVQSGVEAAVCSAEDVPEKGWSTNIGTYFALPAGGMTVADDALLLHTNACAVTKICRREIIEHHQLRFPVGLHFEDEYFFAVYTAYVKNLYFVPERLYFYRRRIESITGQWYRKSANFAADRVQIANLIWQYHEEHRLVEQRLFYLLSCWLNLVGSVLNQATTPKETEDAEAIALPFAKQYIIPHVPSGSAMEKRLSLLLRHRWAGVRRKWGGLLRTTLRDTTDAPFYLATKKVKWMGVMILRTVYRGERRCHYLFGLLPIGRKLSGKKEPERNRRGTGEEPERNRRGTGEEPEVTVLLPVYNAENFVRDAVDSILNQTFRDFELLIINDGSTDRSAEICAGYHDPRIRFVNNSENKGTVAVLNQGLDAARGDFIARMDADDIAFPERLAKQVDFMHKHRSVGILGTWYFMSGCGRSSIIRTPRRVKAGDLLRGSPLGHPTVMFRKSVIEKYKLKYNIAYPYVEDYELWARAYKHTKLANLREVLLLYRVHRASVSCTHRARQQRNGAVVRQKLRTQWGQYEELLELTPDAGGVLDALSSLGEFAYLPNSGNLGDALIASATMQWMDRAALPWHLCRKEESPDTLVYGGGGAWLPAWFAALGPIMAKMQAARRVIILPSTFRDVPELIRISDERFTIFCREKQSFDYLASANTKAEILLEHDMALHLHRFPVSSRRAPAKRLRKASRILHKILKSLPRGEVHLMRKDVESCGIYASDFDLSTALGGFSSYESRENIDFGAAEMLRAVGQFERIHTDRLHVGIAAVLTGTDVILYDNNTQKVSGVYSQSLRGLPHVTLRA